ncbi:hypothetical protein BH09BAC4_BH09BAC4_09620 [soil metagenome]
MSVNGAFGDTENEERIVLDKVNTSLVRFHTLRAVSHPEPNLIYNSPLIINYLLLAQYSVLDTVNTSIYPLLFLSC